MRPRPCVESTGNETGKFPNGFGGCLPVLLLIAFMTVASFTHQPNEQFIDSISWLEESVTSSQTHAEVQQEHIRVAETLVQQLRTFGAIRPPRAVPSFREK